MPFLARSLPFLWWFNLLAWRGLDTLERLQKDKQKKQFAGFWDKFQDCRILHEKRQEIPEILDVSALGPLPLLHPGAGQRRLLGGKTQRHAGEGAPETDVTQTIISLVLLS